MSGIAGIYHLDGRPVEDALLRRMTEAIAHRGPDGVTRWRDGAVGLGHCMLHTTAESLTEKQPLGDETGDLYLTLDGRVDNREELPQTLRAAGYSSAPTATPSWCCGHMPAGVRRAPSGSSATSRSSCGTDGRGSSSVAETSWACGRSSPTWTAGLFGAAPSSSSSWSVWRSRQHRTRGWSASTWRVSSRTPRRRSTAVSCGCPAHILIVRPDGIRKQRYWDGNLTKEIRYRRDAEYAEHFRAIFTTPSAVACAVTGRWARSSAAGSIRPPSCAWPRPSAGIAMGPTTGSRRSRWCFQARPAMRARTARTWSVGGPLPLMPCGRRPIPVRSVGLRCAGGAMSRSIRTG